MYTVVGLEELSFSTDDGGRVDGFKVHFTYDLPFEAGYEGVGADSIFTRRSLMPTQLKVGGHWIPCCNRKGRLQRWMPESVDEH